MYIEDYMQMQEEAVPEEQLYLHHHLKIRTQKAYSNQAINSQKQSCQNTQKQQDSKAEAFPTEMT